MVVFISITVWKKKSSCLLNFPIPPYCTPPSPTSATGEKYIMFGNRAKVRAYAQENKILPLVDELVNELLREMPSNPLEHLESYIHTLREKKGEIDVVEELQKADEQKNRVNTEETRLVTKGSSKTFHSEETHLVSQGSLKATRFSPTSPFEKELSKLWEESKKSNEKFKERLEANVQQKSLLNNIAALFFKTAPAVQGAGKVASTADTSLVQTQLKFDASQDVTQAKTDQGVQLVKPYSAEYKPSQSVTEVVDGLADWFAPGRKLWPKSAINRVKNNCTFMQHKHNYGEAAEVVIPLFIYSISVMTDYTWAFWVTSDGNGRWTPFSGKEAVVLEKDFLEHCRKDGKTLIGEDENLTRPRAMPLSSMQDKIKKVRKELSVAAEDNQDTKNESSVAEGKDTSASSVTKQPVQFEAPTKMQVIFSDGRMVGGNEAEPGSSQRGFRGKNPDHRFFVGWKGLTVFVSTPFLETFKTTSATEDGTKEFYIARYELTDVKDDYEKARKEKTNDTTEEKRAVKEELARLNKRIVLNPYTDTVSWLPVPTCIFKGLAVKTEKEPDIMTRPTTPQKTMSFERLPPPGALEYLQSRRTCEHLEISDGDKHYLQSKDAFECAEREKKVTKQKEDEEKVSKLPNMDAIQTEDGEQGKDTTKRIPYVRCDDPTCFNCAVSALKDRCIQEKNQQQYDKDCDNDLNELKKHERYGRFKTLIENKIAIAVHESPTGEAPTPLTIIHSLDIQEVYWSSDGDLKPMTTDQKGKQNPLYASLSGKSKFITDPDNTTEPPCPLYKSCCEFPDQPYYILNASMRDAQNHVHKTQISVTNKDSTIAKGDKDDAEIFCPRSIASLGKGMGALCEVTRKQPDLCRYLTDLMRLSHQTSFDSETTDMSLWYTSQDIISNTFPSSDEDEYLDPVHYDKLGYYRYTKLYDEKKFKPVFVDPDSIKFQMGDWVSDQVRPLLFYVNEAMKEMSPVLSYRGWRCAPSVGQKQKCYRGLANARLPPELYATGNVVVWSAFSSTSTDQGISQYYAGSQSGKNASVFIVKGSSCRLIAPWSRFGREEEWLYPLNSMFQVETMLTEDQQSILGKKDFQLFEISEVDELSMEKIRIRCSLARAKTKEVARVVFSAVSAVDSGNGVLDLSLKTAKDGVVEAKWVHTVMVNFDALHLSPVMTSNNTKACTTKVEGIWKYFREQAHNQNRFTPENPCVIFDQTSKEGKRVLKATSLILGLRHSKTLSFVEVTCHFKESFLMLKKEERKKQLNEHVSGYYQLKAMNPTEQWEVTIEMRCEEGQVGYAFGSAGAELLHEIIAKQVHLVRIDIRNNDIDMKSAALLLQALRLNKHIVQLIIYDDCDAEDEDDVAEGHRGARSDRASTQYGSDRDSMNEEGPPTKENMETTPQAQSIQQKHHDIHGSHDIYDIQQVINIRCAHNKGTIVANTLSDFGSAWPKYASMALYDLDALDMDFADLFDTLNGKTVKFIQDLKDEVKRNEKVRQAALKKIEVEKVVIEDEDVPYPKLPGALVAAARCCDVSLIRLLLDMKCDPFETDEFGETPRLKMSRRQNSKDHLDPCAQLSQKLYVCLDRLQPAVFRYDEPLWKAKNFALEVMRMADDREDISLATELIRNVRVSYEAFHGNKPPGVTAGDYDKNIKSMVADITTQCKECVILQRLQCPVGRLDSSLLCLKVVCTRGDNLFPLVHMEKGETVILDTRSTGRRKYPTHSAYLSCTQFSNNKEVLHDWGKLPEEGKKPRRMDKNGVYYFEHEVKRTEAMKGVQDTERWIDMKEVDEYNTKRRKYKGKDITKSQFLDMMWNGADEEPKQIRRQNSDGFFVFKHDWDETTEGSKWEKGTKEERPCEPPLVQQLENAALNLYDPKVFGSRIEMEQSREKLQKWAKLWGGVNAVLVTSVEKERELFRKVENVTATAMIHHLRLKRGELYCQPDITLWNVERRCRNPTPSSSWNNASPATDSEDEKAPPIVTDCCRKARTREEFTFDFHDNTGKLWREAQRRWTGKDGQEASYEGELLYENEFKEFEDNLRAKGRRRSSGGRFPKKTTPKCEDMKSDLPPRKPLWEKAKREDPFTIPGDQVKNDGCESNSSITTILFSARGKMQGEWVGALSAEHDVLLPALEMFVVEDIQVRGASLHISLISRGSLLRTDKELRTWCSRIQDTVLHPPKEGRQGKVCTDTVLQAPKKTEVSKDDLTNDENATLVTRSFLSTEEGDFFFSRKSQMLHHTERQKMVSDLQETVRPVNEFGFSKIQGVNKKPTNHSGDRVVDGLSLPTTYRPGKTFLSGLNRQENDKHSHPYDSETEGIPKVTGGELAHVPYVKLAKDLEKDIHIHKTIRISSRTIQAYHDTHKAEDVYFETMDKKERKTPGEYAPPVKDVYGDKEFRITVGEVQQLLKTTTMVTSPSLPQRFVQCLIGSFTSAKHRLLFFNVFRATSLLSIKGNWEAAKKIARDAAKETWEASKTRRDDAIKTIADLSKRTDLSEKDAKNRDFQYGKLYRNRVLININKQIIAYLDGEFDGTPDGDVKQSAEPIETTHTQFVAWMDRVQAESTHYGFTSKEHARLTLTKSMSELSTEMCVSQQGFFFTSGIDSDHNQICEKTQHRITFLAAPGMDFCYKQPTLREAPKYFVRIRREGKGEHEGWSYFQEGKQHEFLHRLKVLYTCIFEAAKKQCVRNMSMLPMGLGVFTQNLGAELKNQVAEMYFRAQFELLAEKDWGFDNVCI